MGSPQHSRSESELSDVNDTAPSTTLPIHAHNQDESADEDMQDMATSQSDEEEDAAGSDYAAEDYAAESPPSPQSNASRRASLSSETSSQPTKRKLDVDDDQYMQENPELYGLRRSVRSLHLLLRPSFY